MVLPRIDVWQIEIPQPPPSARMGASNDCVRALTSRREVRQCAWVAARMITGRILGCSPDELRVERTCLICGDPSHGKPRLIAVARQAPPDVSIAVAERLHRTASAACRRPTSNTRSAATAATSACGYTCAERLRAAAQDADLDGYDDRIGSAVRPSRRVRRSWPCAAVVAVEIDPRCGRSTV